MNYKVAGVTGASSGIGKAIAESLAKNNIRLILVARLQDKLEQLQSKLQTLSHVIACAITDKNKTKAELNNLPAEFAYVDILINCAVLALGFCSLPPRLVGRGADLQQGYTPSLESFRLMNPSFLKYLFRA
jgi:NADP-dependent 3-hydroxy acid dehydrogenase YdfG